MRDPQPSSPYVARRERVAEALGDGALVLHGGQLKTRSADTEFRFRPDSDFYYLTGLAEPGAVLVLRPKAEHALTLFVRPKDPEAEMWSGRRIGPEAAKTHYGADQAFALDALSEKLPDLLDGAPAVHLPLGLYPSLDTAVLGAIEHLRRRNRYGTAPPSALCDARLTIGEDRVVKDAAGLSSLRKAVEITVASHLEAMRHLRPGLYEHEVEARIEYGFRRRGSTGPGYGSIVGGGDNATILHYVDNCDRLDDGDILLIDAGAEWDYFSGDLTRSVPVSGRFTPAQRDLYEIVLAANLAGIERTVVGADIDAIHAHCLRVLCQGLVDLGLLQGELDGLIEDEAYKPFYPHRTSHWLGADVHDAGYYCLGSKPRPLQPGFVLTVEPGLYITADNEAAPAELRGTGIRIEDDVLVGDDGPEVLTHRAPKTVADLEAIIGTEADTAP